MANKIFKGFRQVTEGTIADFETGYIYFVRNSANTGLTDGYLQFNGKKYGTAAEAKAELEALIGELPEGVSTVVDYVEGQLSAITDNFSSDTITGASNGVEVHIGQANGNVTGVTVTAPDFANTYAGKSDFETVSGIVETINGDYLDSSDKTELENAITAETAAREALSADTRLAALEGISADTRIANLEAVSASTRLTGLEASAHTHENKTVLDGITAEKVQEWDDMAAGAAVVLTAYTGSDTGLTEGFLKTYEIFQGGNSVGKIDIPKDMVVTSGVITANTNDEKVLRLTIANQTEPVDIPVADLVDVYTPGNGIEISNSNEVSAKVVSGNGLTLDSNGIAMGLADGSNAGAMSAADFTKLGTIEASAQTNVIETVKVDGTALTVTNKEVNIELPNYDNTYAPKSLTGDVETNRTDFDNYTAATDTRLDTIESGYTQNSVYDAYTAATDNALTSADTRLDALEAISGDSHTHSNKAVLDGITTEKVDDWDAAEQNAKDYADGLKNGLNADVSGDSNGVEVRVQQVSGVVTDVTVTAPDFDATYAPISLNSAATRLDTLEAVSADTRLDALEAVSADTRLNALEAVSAQTSSALQSISAGDASVSVGTKDANNDQTVAVAVSATANNALSLNNDGLFAAIYYDGDDSN